MRRALAFSFLLLGCSGQRAAPPICSHAQALSAQQILGTSLPPKTLALTFDDGPGSRTVELASWLAAQNIHVAFFVNGHCFQDGNGCGNVNPTRDPATVLGQVRAHGHFVGNHTQDHLDLTTLRDAEILSELAATDAIIAPYTDSQFLFRAPYGAWNARDYEVLQGSAMQKYVGTIGWDIGGQRTDTSAADWACWRDPKLTTEECGDLYRMEIDAVSRGIVLMHDADYGTPEGNTIDMAKYLVPQLASAGYSFVRVDEIPEVRSLLPPAMPSDAGVPPKDPCL